MCESRAEVKQDDIGVFLKYMIFYVLCILMEFTKHSEQCTVSSPRQEHFQANITIITYLKYDVFYTTAIA